MVIGFIDYSQAVTATEYNTLAEFHTTNHSTLNPVNVLSLVLTFRFLATDLSQSLCNFKYRCNYSTCSLSVSVSLSLSLMLPPTVSRPVCLGIEHPSGTYDQIFITVTQLQAC
jgi:hypothetical protein